MSVEYPQDQYVRVGEVNTRFWALGDEGAAVILIHGLGGHVESWVLNVHALAEHHRVFALDLVGFGRSDKPDAPYTLPFFAQFVRDFMETQGIERASLVGHSLGGGIAFQFALLHPDQVEKLVSVDGAGLGKQGNLLLRLGTLPLLGEWASRPSRKGTAQSYRQIVYDPAVITEEAIDISHELDCLPGAQQAMLATLRSLANLWGVREEVYRPILDNLGNISRPTLVVWGKQDTILPVAHARVAEERMPGAHVHIFDPCGHMPQVERPEEFNKLLLEFLAG
jgi:4,5:9,10-diseco-3-hydroxy-5,9,17-trioxoandrosta-1(10),2-diene-4-oate hydrolase